MTTSVDQLPTLRARGYIKCLLFVLVTVVMFLPVIIAHTLRLERVRGHMVQLFFYIIGRVSGLRISIEGEICRDRPLMLVANHSSYLDIFALGSLMPLSFTPKLEIRSWPIIGFFCVLADCIFIERRPADMQRAQAEMAERLKRGKVLALFPEGTTGDGLNVMPFKSGFLSLVEAHDMPVQPVTIAYTQVADVPINAENRDRVAWIGDADFVTHYWRLLKFPSVKVHVTFYPPQHIKNFEDRKALAKACEETIRGGLKQKLETFGVTS